MVSFLLLLISSLLLLLLLSSSSLAHLPNVRYSPDNLVGLFITLWFLRVEIVRGTSLHISLVRPAKLNSGTRALGLFSDVVGYYLSLTKA